jgi:hypothetical protein
MVMGIVMVFREIESHAHTHTHTRTHTHTHTHTYTHLVVNDALAERDEEARGDGLRCSGGLAEHLHSTDVMLQSE